ncbi:MAG: hypothetical protein ABI411_20135 [Tahibacter sp.]
MSCVLRVYGNELDVDALISQCRLDAISVRRKGQVRGASGQRHATSGANFVVSNAEFTSFDLRLRDATAFLSDQQAAIDAMVRFPGVESATLDFGVAIAAGCMAQFSYLPPEFIRLAAARGLGVEISQYWCAEDPDEP